MKVYEKEEVSSQWKNANEAVWAADVKHWFLKAGLAEVSV